MTLASTWKAPATLRTRREASMQLPQRGPCGFATRCRRDRLSPVVQRRRFAYGIESRLYNCDYIQYFLGGQRRNGLSLVNLSAHRNVSYKPAKALGCAWRHPWVTVWQTTDFFQTTKNPHSHARSGFGYLKSGRGERIRTSGLYVPNVILLVVTI